MKATIIYAHPYEQSFNHAILTQVEKTLLSLKYQVNIIDLYKDGFNPIMSVEQLKTYSKGTSDDNLVNEYLVLLKQSSILVFIFPIWWYDAPAMMRGFYDKVLLKDQAFKVTSNGLVGLLNIKKAYVFTTSGISNDELFNVYQNPIQTTFINGTLKSIGITNVKYLNFDNMDIQTNNERLKHLRDVCEVIV